MMKFGSLPGVALMVAGLAMMLQSARLGDFLKPSSSPVTTFSRFTLYDNDQRFTQLSFYTATGKDFPLLITPKLPGGGDLRLDLGWLKEFVSQNKEWLHERVLQHGGLLFRNFSINTPQDFENLALLLESDLDDFYLGTSPRNAVNGTKHVFTASEFDSYIAIPVHCEMSFVRKPPRYIMFYAHQPNLSPGGETPISDFRAVWKQLDPERKARLKTGGIRNLRQYSSKHFPSYDPLKTKTWQEMFQTDNKEKAVEIAHEQGFQTEWKSHDTLKLINSQDVIRLHPETKEETWHNHLLVFHISSPTSEFRLVAARLNSWKHFFLTYFSQMVTSLMRFYWGNEDLGQHATYTNGSEILQDDVDTIRALAYNSSVIYSHQQGDVVFIDNYRLAHGRQPYSGDRTVLVAWSRSSTNS